MWMCNVMNSSSKLEIRELSSNSISDRYIHLFFPQPWVKQERLGPIAFVGTSLEEKKINFQTIQEWAGLRQAHFIVKLQYSTPMTLNGFVT